MVRQGAEIIEARLLITSFKPLILTVSNSNRLCHLNLSLFSLFAKGPYSFVQIHRIPP